MTRKLPPILDVEPPKAPLRVVGDVHLTEEEPEVAARFTRYVDHVADEGGTLVLLGDLFDWWVGRAQARRQPFAGAIVKHLGAAQAKGLRIAFLAGNRDYAFNGADGFEPELWPDVVRTRLGERVVVLSHGDLLCSDDKGYLRMRSLLRSAPLTGLLRGLPYAASSYCAMGLRDLSERATRRKNSAQMGIDYSLAGAWLDGYEADALLLGHVHTGVHHRLPGDRPRDVFVLRDWSHAPNEIVWTGSEIRLQGI